MGRGPAIARRIAARPNEMPLNRDMRIAPPLHRQAVWKAGADNSGQLWRAGERRSPAREAAMDRSEASRDPVGRLRIALVVGAAIWLLLLLVGFFAPGGWRWG